MSKACLVMDMPESCCDCQLRRNGYCEPYSWNNALCGVFNNMKSNSKPDWCPLRQMPEKVTEDGLECYGEMKYMQGWNDCIDAIEGKKTKVAPVQP